MVGFPLLLIPLAIYNIIVFLMPGVSFTDPLLTVSLMSGAGWPVTLGDMLLAFGILMLLFEVIKGARPGAKYLTDHLLSLVVFGAAAAEFLLLPRFGTSIFYLLALLALVDFLSGIALRARRRVPAAATVTASERAAARKSDTPPAEPVVVIEPQPLPAPASSVPPPAPPAPEPAREPAPLIPPAASIAESVLRDHPQPKPVSPAAEPPAHPPSPEMPSPELQPDNAPPGTPPR